MSDSEWPSFQLRQAGSQWIAQCVDHDIAAQGPTAGEAIKTLLVLIEAQAMLDTQNGIEPLSRLPPPPESVIRACHGCESGVLLERGFHRDPKQGDWRCERAVYPGRMPSW